ncbi:MAG: type II toxin-antitoxin system RelE/ParE family toxin [Patescibacteria group bacterium]
MAWEVWIYESERGEKLVEEFISTLEASTIAKVSHLIDLLEIHGPFLGTPHTKKVSPNLYELRIRGHQEVRILYTFFNNKICLLSGFQKQTQKTPSKEIEIALGRRAKIS